MENETLPIEEVKTEEHEEVQAKKTDKGLVFTLTKPDCIGLVFTPTKPDFVGEDHSGCAWVLHRNAEGEIITLNVKIGDFRFKLKKSFIPRD